MGRRVRKSLITRVIAVTRWVVKMEGEIVGAVVVLGGWGLLLGLLFSHPNNPPNNHPNPTSLTPDKGPEDMKVKDINLTVAPRVKKRECNRW